MITNTQHPYCCEECGAELGKLIMQHFSKRTIVLGACTTNGCVKRHSHQAAEIIQADARTLEALTTVSQRLNIAIGVFEFAYADALKVGAYIMQTSRGIEYAAPLRANRIEVGHTYYQQNQAAAPFTVVWISDFYLRNTLAAYRVAIVRDGQGFYFGKQIAANLGYFEVEGE